MIRSSLAAAALLLAGLGVAHGQGTPASSSAADAALTEGRRLYDLKEWDKAIAKFKEAYVLREDAAALFNIAQTYRLKGDCANALSFYKTFKKKFPDEKVIAKVEDFIVEMEACVKNPPTTTTPTTTTTPVEPAPQTTTTTTQPIEPTNEPTNERGSNVPRIGSFALMGVGAIGIGAGIFFAVRASSAQSDAEEAPDNGVWDPKIEDKGKSAAKWSKISFAVGGAAAIGGVVLYMLTGTSDHENQPVAITPETGGASLVWSGSF